MTDTKKRVAVGLSGGVDSAVSAALLKEQGYEVTGVFIICYHDPGGRTDEDRKDALDVALSLGIPFEVLDFRKEYQEKVLAYFKAEYEAGRTPNPDVMCNREIKFGLFYNWALRQTQGKPPRFDYIATGHYACVQSVQESRIKNQESRFQLQIPKDKEKDQTYFLYQLREEQLKHIIFPLGGMTKKEVREEADKRGLSVAKKPDSQGICFVGEVGVKDFLKSMGVEEKEGEVVIECRDKNQELRNMRKTKIIGNYEVIGRHKGVWFYTIGQRHGFMISYSAKVSQDRHDMPPLYVVGKNVETNQLIVGTREECMRDQFEVEQVHFVNGDVRSKMLDGREMLVRIRHQGNLMPSKIYDLGSKISVRLGEPVFGVAPGQAAVFYDGDRVLGGGVIS